MAYEEKTLPRPHSLTMEERRRLTVSGVEEVTAFDEEAVTVRTVRGVLIVRGTGLRVEGLDKSTGTLSVAGELSELCYEEERSGSGVLRRLLHGWNEAS